MNYSYSSLALCAVVAERQHKVMLLDGVTGSGDPQKLRHTCGDRHATDPDGE